jgi:hypothetical protein
MLFVEFPLATYNHLLKPIGRGIAKAAEWTYHHLLRPVGTSLQWTANKLFVEFPRELWNHVLLPVRDKIRAHAQWSHEHVIMPIRRAWHDMVVITCSLPKAIYDRVIVPVTSAMSETWNALKKKTITSFSMHPRRVKAI